MNPYTSVLGVVGSCWVVFPNPTQFRPLFFAACRPVCWVCWVLPPAHACASLFSYFLFNPSFFSYAKPYRPDKPNTLNTYQFNLLFLNSFKCVGFVLGLLFCFVLGWVGLLFSGGFWRD